MLTLEEAQRRAIDLAPTLPEEKIAVEDALGRFLAYDCVATRTQPPANLSAMDGYAVGGPAEDGLLVWKLVGESRAGCPFEGSLEQGETVRISTGAHVPTGADRILIQENARVENGVVRCFQDFPSMERHIRLAGFDFKRGDTVLSAGTSIGPAQIALAITAGHAELSVVRQPRVAVLDSGDELVADPKQCGEHQIPASNGAMIAAMVTEMGCKTIRLGPVGDDMVALIEALSNAGGCDVLVTTGGASVGDHDLMRPALENWGAKLDFWKVAMKPGKPVMVGQRGGMLIFGLPGNPVSSFVTAFLLVLPAIRAAMGARDTLPLTAQLPLAEGLPKVGMRREFLRAWWDGISVTRANCQDSSALFALAKANCLIYRPSQSEEAQVGDLVPVFLL